MLCVYHAAGSETTGAPLRYKESIARDTNPISRRLLEAYDELGCESLEFSALAERLPGSAKLDRGALRDVVTELVAQGWLRPAAAAEVYMRTEEGRLALAGPRDVTLYTRPGCHLCEEAKAQLAPLLREYGATLREVNIEADPALRERYSSDIPVIFLGGRKVAKHRVNLAQLRRQLDQSPR